MSKYKTTRRKSVRLILSKTEDCGGLPERRYSTADVDIPELEALLTIGGRSPDGFHVAQLIGAEELDPGVRFIVEMAYSQDGYVLRGYRTVDVPEWTFAGYGTVIGAEILEGGAA